MTNADIGKRPGLQRAVGQRFKVIDDGEQTLLSTAKNSVSSVANGSAFASGGGGNTSFTSDEKYKEVLSARKIPQILLDEHEYRNTPNTDGECFRVIDGEPRSISTVTNGISSVANSASGVGNLTDTSGEKNKLSTRKIPQTLQKKNNQLHPIDECDYAMPNGPQTVEFDANDSLRLSDYSFNTTSSFIPCAVNGAKEYSIEHESQYSSDTLTFFPGATVRSYSALIKEFAGESSSTANKEESATAEESFITADTAVRQRVDVSDCGRSNDNLARALVASGRLSEASTFTSASFKEFRAFVYGNEKEEEVLSDLVSSLQNTTIQQEHTIQQLLLHITKIETQLQSQCESKKAESNEHNQRPMMDPPSRSDDSDEDPPQSQKKYDDLMKEIGRLSDENGQLLNKCQRLEEDENQYKKLLALQNDLQAEKDYIRALVSTTKNELVDFAKVHEDCKGCYEIELARLKDEVNQAVFSKEELNAKLSKENEEAYQLCEILQQEIDMLRKELEEVRGRGESSSENEMKYFRKVSWADEKRKSAPQHVLFDENEANDNVLVDKNDEERDTYRDSF
ncbi:hypothetical protein ACHAXA_011334 [Cyclostephanos tholiformis]|uniref:Uncharacterized protein n=1 Tax=Cyclostephanos tholiformis TaxID=382380 RepID=A0ABD3REC7_9STRA